MEHAAYESTGPGGTLHWRERGDRHWIARGLGGHFDAAPTRHGGYDLYWNGDAGGFVELGHYPTLGAAWSAARSYADGTFVPQRAAEAPAAAAETGSPCAHTHPESVPSAPCPADPGAGSDGPVVIEKTEVAAAKTVLVAGEEGGLSWSHTYHSAGIDVYRASAGGDHAYIVSRRKPQQWHLTFGPERPGKAAPSKRLGSFPTLTAAKKEAARHHGARAASPPKAKRGARRTK